MQRPQSVSSWTSAQLGTWLQSIGLGDLVANFVKEGISGATLRDLSENDLKELGLNMGQRKTFMRERETLLAQQASVASGKPPPRIPKGYLPVGKPLTQKQMEKVVRS